MRIFSRPLRPPHKRLTRLRRFRPVLLALFAVTSSAFTQTLARPGWVGSGLSSQAWWRSAVIYRVQPQSFQDSDGDGVGDLRGLAQRLDYLQSIGVDAVLIESHTNDPGFDDLLSDASRHHIRILVPLADDTASHSITSDQAISQARSWLRRGVAGLYVPSALLSSIAARTNFNEAVFLLQLRSAADNFPGERVVICGDSPAVDAASSSSAHSGPEIVDGTIDTSVWDAASLRTKLVLANSPAAGEPLLQTARDLQHKQNRDSILAALLLSSRGAVGLSYGQEIGLPNTSPYPTMRWTPSNLTHPHKDVTEKPKEEVYGAYHPYVPPAPNSVVGPRPQLPSVALNTEAAPPPTDPDTLPGFSTRPASDVREEKTVNVAVEDERPDSLLNFYRRVLELHSGNATLRTGSVSFLNHDNEGALVWLRRAPAGARTVASVVVVCNMTDHPIDISLATDLAHLHIRSGYVRPLLTSRHIDHIAQSIGNIRVSANSVYIGELHYR